MIQGQYLINFPDIKNKLLDDSGPMGFILTFLSRYKDEE